MCIVRPALELSNNTSGEAVELTTVWRVMAERMTTSWTNRPPFLPCPRSCRVGVGRPASASCPGRRETVGIKPSISDLLVKLVAASLVEHPRLNARWEEAAFD